MLETYGFRVAKKTRRERQRQNKSAEHEEHLHAACQRDDRIDLSAVRRVNEDQHVIDHDEHDGHETQPVDLGNVIARGGDATKATDPGARSRRPRFKFGRLKQLIAHGLGSKMELSTSASRYPASAIWCIASFSAFSL